MPARTAARRLRGREHAGEQTLGGGRSIPDEARDRRGRDAHRKAERRPARRQPEEQEPVERYHRPDEDPVRSARHQVDYELPDGEDTP